jgi:hypothetical protein
MSYALIKNNSQQLPYLPINPAFHIKFRPPPPFSVDNLWIGTILSSILIEGAISRLGETTQKDVATMDTDKHTPGPYHVVRHNEQQMYPAAAAYAVEIWTHDGEQPVALATDAADAALLAAAPDMLAALREIADPDFDVIPWADRVRALTDIARAALAKAGAA